MKYMNQSIIVFSAILFFLNCNKSILNNSIGIRKPNIILIVADDLGYRDLSLNGNKLIETPHLDLLAREGVHYKYGYAAAPLCSPTRASIVTGLSPARLHLTEHIHGHQPTPPGQKFITPKTAQGLDTALTTLPEVLSGQGYRCAHLGKWHLGGGASGPEHHGYHFTFGGSWAGLPNSFFYPFFNGNAYPELKSAAQPGDYLTDVLTQRAIEWIDQEKDHPFFVSLNFYAPHVPIEGKPQLVQYYEEKAAKTGTILPNAHYAAMVHAIDENVGKIMQHLKDNQLEENTLVLFTSDNGALDVEEVPAFAKHTPPTTNWPLKAGKGYMQEGGLRVPFIATWKGHINPGMVSAEPVISTDLMNTFAALAGAGYQTSDGVNIAPTWMGKSLNRNLYWYFPHYSPQRGTPAAAVRQGPYKLLIDYERNKISLYHLDLNEGETIDIADQKPALVQQLHRAFLDWKAASGAQELIPNKR